MSRLLRCALICGICAGFSPHHDDPEDSMGHSKSTKARKSTKHNAFGLSLEEIKRYHLRSAMHAIVASGALKECYKDYQSRRDDCLAADKEDVRKVVAFFDDIKKHGERQHKIDSVAWNEFAKIYTLFLRYALPAGPGETHEYRMSLGDSAAIMTKALLEFWRIEVDNNQRLAFDKSYEDLELKIAQYVFKNHSILQERLRRSVERVQSCPEYANVAAIEVLYDSFSELESSAKDKAEEFVVPDIMQEITEGAHGSIQSIPIEEARLLVGLTQESQTLARELSKVRAGASEDYNEYCREMQAIQHQWFMTMLLGSKSDPSESAKAKLAGIVEYV